MSEFKKKTPKKKPAESQKAEEPKKGTREPQASAPADKGPLLYRRVKRG